MAMLQFSGDSRKILQGLWTFSLDGNGILALSPRRKPNLVGLHDQKHLAWSFVYLSVFSSQVPSKLLPETRVSIKKGDGGSVTLPARQTPRPLIHKDAVEADEGISMS